MTTRKIILFLSVLLIISLSCTITGSNETDTPQEPEAAVDESPEPDLQSTIDAMSTAEAQAELEDSAASAKETQDALEAEEEAARQETQAAIEAEAAQQETQAAIEEQTAATQKAEEEMKQATEAVLAVQTEQAGAMLSELQLLYDDGVIASTDGTYYPVGDFDESWAQLGWFQWWDTGYSAENFVLTTEASWDSASDKANWPQSGCGFVFGQEDDDHYNYTWLGLDGWGYIIKYHNQNHKALAVKKYGNLDTPGGAKLTLAMYDQRASMYVNGEQVYRAYDGLYTPGSISLTLMSGTNAGFGTRCTMENTGLWIFD